MIGKLLRRGGPTPMEARLDELEAAIDTKLQALLATATQAIAEAIRAELARERQHTRAASLPTQSRHSPARSLLDLEAGAGRVAELRRLQGTLARTRGNTKTETGS